MSCRYVCLFRVNCLYTMTFSNNKARYLQLADLFPLRIPYSFHNKGYLNALLTFTFHNTKFKKR